MSVGVVLDKVTSVYTVGESISGFVHVQLDKPKIIRKVAVDIRGNEKTRWISHRSKALDGQKGSQQVIYSGTRQLFDHRLVLTEELKQFVLPQGKHTYRFEYVIPTHAPANYDGTFGYIEYHIRAFVDIPWAYDYECRVPFTVIPLLDLNMVKPAKDRLYFESNKIFGVCCCASGYIRVVVTAPKSGFIRLENIPLTICIQNYSSVKVHRTDIEVMKYVNYLARTNDRDKKDDNMNRSEKFLLLKEKMETKVGANGGEKSFVFFIPLVSTELTTLDSQAIIQFSYEVTMQCKLGGLHRAITESAPILIGTIPIITDEINFQKLPENAPSGEAPNLVQEDTKLIDAEPSPSEAPSSQNSETDVYNLPKKSLTSTEALNLLDDMISDENLISLARFSIKEAANEKEVQGTSRQTPKRATFIEPSLSTLPSDEKLAGNHGKRKKRGPK